MIKYENPVYIIQSHNKNNEIIGVCSIAFDSREQAQNYALQIIEDFPGEWYEVVKLYRYSEEEN